MSDGKLGLGDVLRGAFRRPRQLFEAWQRGRVEARPFVVYAVSFVAASAQTGLELGAFWSLLALALLPLSWFVGTGVLHLLVRLLGGSGKLSETKAAVGFGSAPRLLGLFGILAFAGEPWLYLALLGLVVGELYSYVVTAIGLMSLHRLRLWRAGLVVLLPIVAPVALALGLRSWVIEAFKIPSGAMQPTLQIQDHLFVTKSTYGWFDKVAPRRGEVVVFTYPDPNPENPAQDFIKRVVALPGDTLELESGAPLINGWRVPRCHLGRYSFESALDGERQLDLFVEFLQGHAYVVEHDLEPKRDLGKQGPYQVAADEFWVLGDARNNSADSRVWRGGRGAGVPFANLRGRAWLLWLPRERSGVTLHGRPVLPEHLKHLEPALERCLASAPTITASTPPAAR